MALETSNKIKLTEEDIFLSDGDVGREYLSINIHQSQSKFDNLKQQILDDHVKVTELEEEISMLNNLRNMDTASLISLHTDKKQQQQLIRSFEISTKKDIALIKQLKETIKDNRVNLDLRAQEVLRLLDKNNLLKEKLENISLCDECEIVNEKILEEK